MAPSSSARTNISIASHSIPSVDFALERVDPVERAIVFVLAAPLHVDETYVLKIHPSADPRSTLAAFDGAPFEGTVSITFHTKATVDPPAKLDTAVDPCLVIDNIFFAACTGSCCHGAGSSPAAMGLNLLADSMVRSTAIGHESVQVQDQSAPNGPGTLQPRNFPYGMPIISPGSSAASYLMYKVLLAAPDSSVKTLKDSSLDPLVGDTKEDLGALFFRELRSRMVGGGMPEHFLKDEPESGKVCSQSQLDADKVRKPLTWEQVQQIRQWIDEGALSCPCNDNTVPKSVKAADPNCAVKPLGDAGVDGGDSGTDANGDASDAGSDAGDTATDGDASG